VKKNLCGGPIWLILSIFNVQTGLGRFYLHVSLTLVTLSPAKCLAEVKLQ